MSISVFYKLAKCVKYRHDDDENSTAVGLPYLTEAGEAILKAARRGRVSYRMALDIIEKLEPPPEPQPDEPPVDPLDDEPPPGADPTPEQRWQSSLGHLAGNVIGIQAHWTGEFVGWEEFEVPSELLTLAKQAADALTELVARLDKSTKPAKPTEPPTKSSAVKSAADRAEKKARAARRSSVH